MTRLRRGLSLLEVILAIAIFGGSLAVIGELIRLGTRSAMEARELTTAQLYCESKMAEVASGIIPQQPIGLTPIDIQNPVPEWYYTVEIAQTDREGLLGVYVMVIKNPDLATTQPISFSLVRWMKDAALVAQGSSEDLAAMEEAALAESEAAAGSGSANGSSANGGSAAGGNNGG
ncbi:MAG: prepilin-type N-terminal cleavage/methylation domain-containing protein, partial [Planctomycetales bacterium]|nr:prepilin-type N-terminal cleavage/methylation domain-containing protein [Planctomycetales bacterium]